MVKSDQLPISERIKLPIGERVLLVEGDLGSLNESHKQEKEDREKSAEVLAAKLDSLKDELHALQIRLAWVIGIGAGVTWVIEIFVKK